MITDEEKEECISAEVTLDGRKATISGKKLPFAQVRSLDGKLHGEWAWETALKIVRITGKFHL